MSPNNQTTCVDYIRQASRFSQLSLDRFYQDYLHELADLTDWIPGEHELEKVERVWQLCRKHGIAVREGIRRIQEDHDDPFKALVKGSLLYLIATREHLRPEVQRLIDSILNIVRDAIPKMFRVNPPKDEPDLNTKVSALLQTHYAELVSEHPTVTFACARAIPDHTIPGTDLLIESKYIRGSTTPSKASKGIAEDLIKYPREAHILFLVLDLDHRIPSDVDFTKDYQSRGQCTICILR